MWSEDDLRMTPKLVIDDRADATCARHSTREKIQALVAREGVAGARHRDRRISSGRVGPAGG